MQLTVNGALSLRGASVPSRVGEGHKNVLENVTTRHPPTGERTVWELQSRHGLVVRGNVRVSKMKETKTEKRSENPL